MTRIFGIGLTHSGTTSLNEALRILGWDSSHWPTINEVLDGKLTVATTESVGCFYRYLDQRHAGSKFILTVRPVDPWIKSVKQARERWQGYMRQQPEADGIGHLPDPAFSSALVDRLVQSSEPKRQLFGRYVATWIYTQTYIYKSLLFDESAFRAARERYNDGVQEYFRGRDRDLLVLRVTEGDGWDKLCAFLGKPVPKEPFPHQHLPGTVLPLPWE